ncbi:UNVERIFIED_CONTAM: hypothetical protein Slati_1329800 [Sesamum latifolium]|uniref:ATP-dependent DNA helicase n=1 Tax=Sesamum latifolium TaxID=2727402 RepID=A0AAW2XHK5_9LAMI
MKFHNPSTEHKIFGGKTMLLGGDFKQILPVVAKGGRSEIIAAWMTKQYLSADTICPSSADIDKQSILYPVEFLNTLKFSGIPDHKLDLKVGVPIILLRNLNQSIGLCNGTWLIITQLADTVIEAEAITENNTGRRFSIHRIDMSPSESKWPFIFKMRQFSVKVCFAMTINKSQGQTFDNVGVYLPKPVFSHDVIEKLSKKGPIEDTKYGKVRNIELIDQSGKNMSVALWGNTATMIDDDYVSTSKGPFTLVVTSTKVGQFRGAHNLKSTFGHKSLHQPKNT